MRRIIVAILVIVLILLLYSYSPKLDIALALLPYNSITHMFYGETAWWCKIIYFSIPVITTIIIISSIVGILFAQKLSTYFNIAKNFNVAKINMVKTNIKTNIAKTVYNAHNTINIRKSCIIILLSLIIGPGIIANGVLKNHWGRARPYQVIRDNSCFSPAWQANWGAEQNNSTPSGHAAIGFFLGVPFLAFAQRKRALIIGALGGIVVGIVRMLQGGHYLSDVISSAIIVWLTTEAVIYVVNRFDKRLKDD